LGASGHSLVATRWAQRPTRNSHEEPIAVTTLQNARSSDKTSIRATPCLPVESAVESELVNTVLKIGDAYADSTALTYIGINSGATIPFLQETEPIDDASIPHFTSRFRSFNRAGTLH
jgi:hypothetical protein